MKARYLIVAIVVAGLITFGATHAKHGGTADWDGLGMFSLPGGIAAATLASYSKDEPSMMVIDVGGFSLLWRVLLLGAGSVECDA